MSEAVPQTPQPDNQRHPFRNTAGGIASVLVTLAGVLILLALLLQTPPSKRMLASQISSRLSTPERVIKLQGLSGLIPFNMNLDRISVADREGTWLTVQDLSVDIAPAALLRRRVYVEAIGAERVTVNRLPVKKDKPTKDWKLPAIPNLPAWLTIERAAIETIDVAQAALGDAATFSANGKYVPHAADDWALELHAQRRDAANSKADAVVAVSSDTIALRLDVEDHLVLPRLLKVEAPVVIALEGAGPLNDWEARLAAHGGGEPIVNADVTLNGIDTLALVARAEINLAHPVIPENLHQRFGPTASISADGTVRRPGIITLTKATVTTEQANINLSGTVDLSTKRMDLATQATHEDLVNLIRLPPETQPLPLAAEGSIRGTFKQPALDIVADLRGQRTLDLDGTFTFAEMIGFEGQLQLWPPPGLLQERVVGLLNGMDAQLAVQYAREGVVHIERAGIRAPFGTLQASGHAQTKGTEAKLEFAATVNDLTVLQPITERLIQGSATAQATLTGLGDTSEVVGTITAQQLAVEDAQFASGTVEATVTFGHWPQGLREVRGVRANASLQQAQWRQITPRDVRAKVDAAFPEPERVQINTLELHDGNVALLAHGDVNPRDKGAALDVSLNVQELRDVSALFEQKLSGTLAAEGHVVTGADQVLAGTLNGTLTNPGGLPEAAQVIGGDRIALVAEGTYQNKFLDFTSAQLETSHLQAQGSGRYGLETKNMNLKVHATTPQAAFLEPVLKRPVSGSLKVDATVGGTKDDLMVDGTASSPSLTIQNFHAEQWTARFTVADLPKAPAVKLDVSAVVPQGEPRLQTEFTFNRPILTVDSFKLVLAENSATGKGTINVETKAMRGDVDIDAPDLTSAGEMLGQDLSGRAEAHVDTTVANGKTTLTGTLTARNLKTPAISAERLDGKFNITDPGRNASGSAELTGSALVAAQSTWESLQVEASGSAALATVSANGAGVYKDGLPLTVALRTDVSVNERWVRVQELKGKAEEYPFQLVAPSTITFAERKLTITPLAVEIAGGTIRAEGGYDPSMVNLTASWEDLPLKLAQLTGAPEMEGAAAGRLTITGPSAAPRLDGALAFAGVKTTLAPPEVPPLNLDATATIAAGSVSTEATVDVSGAGELKGNASFPATFAMQPFQFSVPPQGVLTGSVTGNADLASIPQLMGIEEHLLSGAFLADLRLTGAVRAPQVSGDARVENGRYENIKAGTILNEVDLGLDAQGNSLRITRLTATDGDSGRVEGDGNIILAPTDGFPFEMNLRATQARLVRRDDITGIVDGNLTLAGRLKNMTATGALTFTPLVLTLPRRLPAKELEVVEVTAKEPRPAEAQEGAELHAEDRGEREGVHADYIFPNKEAPVQDVKEPESGLGVALDLDLDFPRAVTVQGHGLESEWRGHLKVTGNQEDPRFVGQFEVVRGELEFLGRRFELEEGTIIFDADRPPSPYINVLATAEADEITAQLRLIGNFNSLDLQMQSDPALPEDEVISHVLFGRDMSQVSPVQALQLAQYLSMFSGRENGLRLLSGPTELPGLSQLNFRSGESGESTVGLGKYLSEDIYLELEQGIGGNTSRARVEIEVTDEVSVEGQVGAENRNSVGVYWKKDY